MGEPIITRVWAMPHKYTFNVRPLREIVLRYMNGDVEWLDPFAGFCSPVSTEWQNDLDPSTMAKYHLEAVDFLSLPEISSRRWAGAILDPPYSLTQVSRSYKNIGFTFHSRENPTGGFPRVRDLLAERIRIGGICISFGWNTVGLGKMRGFEPVEYLICSHGGNRNDTLVTVERRHG